MRFTIIALAVSLVATATAAPLDKRIIGGGPVLKDDIPYIVEIQAKGSLCTGFLVDSQTVMKACKHYNLLSRYCHIALIFLSKKASVTPSKALTSPGTIPKSGAQVEVAGYGGMAVGINNLGPWMCCSFSFQAAQLHEQYYNSTLNYNDTDMVFLEKKVSVEPARLLTPSNSYPKTGSKVVAAGYGDITNAVGVQPAVQSEVLNKVTLTVSSKTTCKENFPNFLGESQFCTDYVPLHHAVCHGDSGGRDRYVIGLINHGVGKGIKCGERGG
ncbi:MAG: trypsin-like cysteine/serine peptidase domain-containing protein [Benniella sp.]|nr:MAG: trypsin-like cysteine/serine peptidase domain-containing protein [Benniella sp.]